MPSIAAKQISSPDVRRSETQGLLIISKEPAGAGVIGQTLIGQTLSVEGTYECLIETHDWSALEVILKPSAVTGTITPVLNRLYANRVEVRTATNGVAFIAGTPQTITSTTVVGTHRFRVDIAVGAGESVTFAASDDPTAQDSLAEYNGA